MSTSLTQQLISTNKDKIQGRTPGYLGSLRSGAEFISYILKDVLGVDPMLIVNASIILAALSTFTRWVTNTLYRQAQDWIISSVTINDDDPLYQIVLNWMADKYLPVQGSRAAKAISVKTSTLEDDENALSSLEASAGRDGMLNYRAMIGRAPVQFQFEKVTHLFRHQGRFFWFKHMRNDRNALRRMDPYRENVQIDVCHFTLECVGRTAEPIRKLILEAQAHELTKPQATVRVCRAMSAPGTFLTRPARSIDTVIVQQDKKAALLADINEYLHPRTRRWYNSHGIPYRRGYLFSGPPGTGKTSLTASLAGLFGLDLYTFSLLDPHVNEGSLTNFFINLQTRCIVLLEDIDAAGLKRDEEDDGTGSIMPYHMYMMKPSGGRRMRHVSTVSLSGLLNALDGAASQEGRIVIMTSNHPEKLDEALIRPGRVDMHITFDLPNAPEMHDLFLSMYRNLTNVNDVIAGAREKEQIPEQELKEMAEEFAECLPKATLSLAAIQGYLLRYKDMPREALAHAAEWAVKAIAEKTKAEEKERAKEKFEARKLAIARAEAKVAAAKAEAAAREELAKLDKHEKEEEEAKAKAKANEKDTQAPEAKDGVVGGVEKDDKRQESEKTDGGKDDKKQDSEKANGEKDEKRQESEKADGGEARKGSQEGGS